MKQPRETHDEIIIAGFGGQGVISLGRFIALLALKEGYHVTYMPSYGVEVRGGTANCTVIYSAAEIASPLTSAPSTVFAMNAPSVEKFAPSVREGGTLIYNSSLIKSVPPGNALVKIGVPANELAIAAGSVKSANVVMLGAYISLGKLAAFDTVSASLEDVLGGKREFIGINRNALEKGGAFCPEPSAGG